MTKRLYYDDSYLTAFQAVVLDRADEGRRVYLDRTAFYPTSGGQPHDTGRLANADKTFFCFSRPMKPAMLAGRYFSASGCGNPKED